MSIFNTDVWRIGIIKATMSQVITEGLQSIHWLKEEPNFTFLADPFGLFKQEKLYIFAEAYDYREKHGKIDVLVLSQDLQLLDRSTVLKEPWHLSYPMIVEDKKEIFMLPEAHNAEKTSLYQAINFPYQWERVKNFSFPAKTIDPTLIFYKDLWWMFYTPIYPDVKLSRQRMLCIAYAKELKGVWNLHPMNPVRITPASSRPGGSAIVIDDSIYLPTQNCTYTYGGSLSYLKISQLNTEKFEAHTVFELNASSQFGHYNKGVHTLSSAGPYTLIDAKNIVKKPIRRLFIDGTYHFKKLCKFPIAP
ncbi:hypothetical protein COMNV_00243 [Commensalibacter sp. Nvir]|uniref:glucosamine inositolphosphorylceramide transferase family protein n=1 Tax=Commensalibacter sp. Nvir TaxID=3069817 RepID=UPI002D4DEF72|nr:hypothetical protein COMNV_00243 [Commensalibacter sp. Nvir]